MSRPLWQLSACEIAARVRDGSTTARAVVEAALARAAAVEPKLHAFLDLGAERALARADELDAKRRRGEALGALAGVPVAIKDNLCITGVPTTCASKILAGWKPPYTATVVEKLLAADAVPFGKTNLDEFAMGSSTENSAFQTTLNPWDTGRIPGGSSGGSAVAVAAGVTPLALGSDTGGSIRQPAALCGVVGLKPTYGRVSRYGLVAFASSLDQIGPFARDARDCALLLQVIAGHDPRDSTSSPRPVPDYPALLEERGDTKLNSELGIVSPLSGLRLGVPKEYFVGGLEPGVETAVREAIETFRRLGAAVREVSLPHSQYAVAVYYLVATAEASSNLARYDGVHYGLRRPAGDLVGLYSRSRAAGFGDEVKRRIMLGTYALSAGYYDAYYLKALKVRTLLRRDFERAFEQADLLVTPVTPTTAFRLGEKTSDPLSMYLSDIFTISANLAGIPGLALPGGFSGGLPVGLQLLGRDFDEAGLLKAAWAFEQATDFHARRPEV